MSVQLHVSWCAPSDSLQMETNLLHSGSASRMSCDWVFAHKDSSEALMCLWGKSNYFQAAKDHPVHWGEFDCLMLGLLSMTQANVSAPVWNKNYREVFKVFCLCLIGFAIIWLEEMSFHFTFEFRIGLITLLLSFSVHSNNTTHTYPCTIYTQWNHAYKKIFNRLFFSFLWFTHSTIGD